MVKPNSLAAYRLKQHFDFLRESLKDQTFTSQLPKPIAHWAVASDRHLPFDLLGRTLEEILNTSFSELCAIEGIGVKKLESLNRLLHRVTKIKDYRPTPDSPVVLTGAKNGEASPADIEGQFDHTLVTESQWECWRREVDRFDLWSEPLGRLARSLQTLPTVIWETPLNFYKDLTLEDIRGLKMYGARRIRGILEVFSSTHRLLSRIGPEDFLGTRLMHKNLVTVERWVANTVLGSMAPTRQQVCECLAVPLVEQLQIDVGPITAKIVEQRLGITTPARTVRHISFKSCLPTARIYQHFALCTRVMRVRWPDGADDLARLNTNFEHLEAEHETRQLLNSTIDVFYKQ